MYNKKKNRKLTDTENGEVGQIFALVQISKDKKVKQRKTNIFPTSHVMFVGKIPNTTHFYHFCWPYSASLLNYIDD